MGEGLFLYFAGVGDLVVVLTTALGVGKRKGGGGGGLACQGGLEGSNSIISMLSLIFVYTLHDRYKAR